MSTPKEIIEEFDKAFVVPNGGVMPKQRDYGKKLERDLKSFFISKIISEYEEMLGEVSTHINPMLRGVQCDPYEVDPACVAGRNKERSNLRIMIEAKLKAWRELRDNK